MSKDIIQNLENAYSSAKLNEADTRFKIIDTILIDILKWPKGDLMLEVILKGVRADYVLYGKNSKPILIIESKKSGKYFELPVNINSQKNYQKITLESLLTDKNIKEAVMQVKDYCEDLGCNYACICNGFTWIFFCINSNQGPWKKLPCFVIKNLKFFSEDFVTANNLFSYSNILNHSSLKKNIGVSRQLYSEIFYPKSSITAYDMPVNSNNYASYFNSISRKFFGNIPIDDSIFYENCYVVNKGHHDDLQKNIHGIIYDSLTPFFKNEGVKNFSDDKKGGEFTHRVEELMRSENLDNVMILFGGRGAGKSTFIKRLIRHLKPRAIKNSLQCIVDLIDSSQVAEELSQEIWKRVLISIDKEKLIQGSREELIILFSERFNLFKKQILNGYIKESVEYNRLLNEFILRTLDDTKYCCEIISRYWKAQNKGLIIVLDNMDQLRGDLQDVCFLTANELAKKLSGLVIIAMREERYFNAKSKGVLDAYTNPGFHITSPVIPEVIGKRVDYAVKNLEQNINFRKEIGINDSHTFTIIRNFLLICGKEVRRKDSDFAQFLRYSTHGDVRQALDFFKGFLQSGYTNVNEMSSDLGWKFQSHQVIKPMMIPDRFFYDEIRSRMPNLYQLRDDINSSHFSGLRILQILNNRSFDKGSAGLLDVKFLIQKFENDYDLKSDCINHLKVFLSKGIIEANNRLEEFSEVVDQVKITSFGKYILEFLAYDFTYLDLISLDSGLFDEELNNFMIASAKKEIELYDEKNFVERIHKRLFRVERFIDYLEKQEEKEFSDLVLLESDTRFTKKLRENFDIQKRHVLWSLGNRIALNNQPPLELPFE